MEVILLQKVRNLGNLGDTVSVRSGFGRNFLMPRGIALPATAANLNVFEQRRSELMAQSEQRLDRARGRAEKIRGREFVIAMRASDEGKLFGSVGPHEIADKVTEEAAEIDAKEVVLLNGQIRQMGEYAVLLQLHPEVEVEVTVLVAQRTALGINMPTRRGAVEEQDAAEQAAAEQADEASTEQAPEWDEADEQMDTAADEDVS